MIPLTAPYWQDKNWKKALAEAIREPKLLWETLNLPLDTLPAAQPAHQAFPLRVPRSYVARMRKGDAHDPLLLQVLPGAAEALATPGFLADPVGDLAAMPVPGLLHKYRGRVLLITTAACAVHCRYCFRRHFPYTDANAAPDNWQTALDYIAQRDDIHEVILSGGDPLTISDERLSDLALRLARIPHVQRLRIHTRVPMLVPERVDEPLLRWLNSSRLQTVMVMHINHAQEIDSPVRDALAALRDNGTHLLNQAVLLRGVNDTLPALADLSEALFTAGVLPYYLHMLDRVQGAAHFEVPEGEANLLLNGLKRRLPGYLVPRLVREQSNAPYKLDVATPSGADWDRPLGSPN